MNFNNISQELNQYFAGLTDYQKYAWIAVIIGFFMIIFALILW